MQEHKVILTWEAIYDAIDITEYIEVILYIKSHFHPQLSFM